MAGAMAGTAVCEANERVTSRKRSAPQESSEGDCKALRRLDQKLRGRAAAAAVPESSFGKENVQNVSQHLYLGRSGYFASLWGVNSMVIRRYLSIRDRVLATSRSGR